jgi:hypothetical protein
MALTAQEARGLFTQMLLDVYQERIRPKSFLRSFFPSKFSPTKNVSVEVERGFEKVAVDVVRGSEGNYNRFSRKTQKLYEPPMWREYFNATELDLYDLCLGALGTDNKRLFAQLLNDVADRIGQLQDKIERAKEIQCSQVLVDGQVTMVNGDTINFQRKAQSMVDLNIGGNGGYFYNNSEAFDQIATGCKWLRVNGKAVGFRYNAIFGEQAFNDFLKNTKVLGRQDLFNMKLDAIQVPEINAVGGALMGTITCGVYQVQVWTYPDFYDSAAGVAGQPYIPTDQVILLPPKPRFHFAHCLVPQLLEPGQTQAPQTGEWVYGDYIDTRKAKHDFDVQTCGVPVPVAIDQIYTMKVR